MTPVTPVLLPFWGWAHNTVNDSPLQRKLYQANKHQVKKAKQTRVVQVWSTTGLLRCLEAIGRCEASAWSCVDGTKPVCVLSVTVFEECGNYNSTTLLWKSINESTLWQNIVVASGSDQAQPESTVTWCFWNCRVSESFCFWHYWDVVVSNSQKLHILRAHSSQRLLRFRSVISTSSSRTRSARSNYSNVLVFLNGSHAIASHTRNED